MGLKAGLSLTHTVNIPINSNGRFPTSLALDNELKTVKIMTKLQFAGDSWRPSRRLALYIFCKRAL